MSEKKNLIFVSNDQFGYLIGTIYYAKYLKDIYEITVICFDQGKKRIDCENINIHYITKSGSIKKRIALLKFLTKSELRESILFVHYFPLCFIIPIAIHCQLSIIDIRTGKISINPLKRIIYNLLIKFESFFFSRISVISESLKKNLFLPQRKSFILPLGAEELSSTNKIFFKIKLLYIGKLSKIREIHKTINGLYQFIKSDESNRENVEYHIVGNGNDEKNLQKLVLKLNMTDCIHFYGYKPHNEIKQLFDNCNVGVSFIPKKAGFDLQPPTKTFEYLKSGMCVIATSTYENSLVINDNNGVLINDTEQDFEKALNIIMKIKFKLDSKIIRESVKNNSWENIVRDSLNLININIKY